MKELNNQIVSHKQGRKVYLVIVTLFATVGGFIFGYDTLIVSGAIVFLKQHFSLNPAQEGFAVGGALLGCLVGSIVAGALSDRLGRKKTMMLAAILFAVSAIGSALPRTIFEFNVYRLCGGVGVGVAMLISPTYISEIAPARIRDCRRCIDGICCSLFSLIRRELEMDVCFGVFTHFDSGSGTGLRARKPEMAG